MRAKGDDGTLDVRTTIRAMPAVATRALDAAGPGAVRVSDDVLDVARSIPDSAPYAGIEDARLAATEHLLATPRDALSPREWSTLADLLDEPVVRDYLGDLSSVGNGDQAKLARSIADDPDRVRYWPSQDHDRLAGDRLARRWFAEFGYGQLDAAQRGAQLHELLGRHSSTLDDVEWRRLASLLDDTDTVRALPVRFGHDRMLRSYALDPAVRAERHPSEVQQLFQRYELAQLPAEQRAERLTQLLSRRADELDPEQWNEVHVLAGDRDIAARAGIGNNFPGSYWALSQWAPQHAAGHPVGLQTSVFFERASLVGMSIEQRAAEARELLGKHPTELTSGDWLRLAALTDDVELRVHVGLRAEANVNTFSGRAFPHRALDHAMGDGAVEERMRREFVEYQQTSSSTYAERLDAAIDAVARDEATPLQREVVADAWERIGAVMEGRPVEERTRLASVMLGIRRPATSPTQARSELALVRAHLDDLEQLLESARDLPKARQIVDDARELVARNQARLAGRTPEGAVVGYGRHPDYAELGRIRASISALRVLAEQQPPGAATGLAW